MNNNKLQFPQQHSRVSRTIGTNLVNQLQSTQFTHSRSQREAQSSLQEIEDVFDESMFDIDDLDEAQSLFTKLKRKARQSFRPSIYLYQTIALVLNICIVLTAYPFNLIPRQPAFTAYFCLSAVVTYWYLFNYKSYSIYEFDDLYAFLKKRSITQAQDILRLQNENPHQHYVRIIKYLSDEFPGVFFEYKMTKRIQDSSRFLEESRNKSAIMKFFRKLWKNLFRQILFWRQPSAAERFINASDTAYLKYIKAEYWQNNDVNWIYFMYLNPLVVTISFFGGFQVILLDVILLVILSKVNELQRAQQFGDKLLGETLKFIEKRSQVSDQVKKTQNGEIVKKYIKHLRKKAGMKDDMFHDQSRIIIDEMQRQSLGNQARPQQLNESNQMKRSQSRGAVIVPEEVKKYQ